jgi:hypothetical protein
MFSKTNLISTVVGAIWAYFGGWLLWGILGASLFSSPNTDPANQMHLIIACVISTFAVSTIYSKLAGGDHSLSHGATYGLLVGLLIGFGERWYDFAFANLMDMTGSIINGILNLVLYCILGVLTSIVYSKVKSA